MGTGLRFSARAVARSVPSPPRTISKSTLPGISLRVSQGSEVLMMSPVSLSIQTSMSRSRSHLRSGGTISRISSFFGFEMIPIFLMVINVESYAAGMGIVDCRSALSLFATPLFQSTIGNQQSAILAGFSPNCMQEILEVSLRAWQDALSLGKIAKAQFQHLA